MQRLFMILLLTALAGSLSGCKLIMDKPKEEAEIPADQSGDIARNAIRLEQTFESKLLPHITKSALPLAELKTLLSSDFAAAGAAHANRGAGQGAAWNFSVKGDGIVIESKLDTRARWIVLDTNKDGKSDIKLQLGPVIRGTALRDVAPFYKFDEFRDQIEFAKLSRAINDRIKKTLNIPDGELIGRSVQFIGVVPMKSATQEIILTPTSLEFSK